MKTYFICAAFAAAIATSCGSGSIQNDQAEKGKVNDIKSASATTMDNKIPQPPPPKQEDAQYDFASSDKHHNSLKADTSLSGQSADTTLLQSGSPANNPDWDKKIIKTANLSLELKDYASYNNDIHSKVKRFGAYIAQEQQTETETEIQNEVSIKVPVDRFEDLMNVLGGDGIKIINKRISTEDVSAEVVDTKARLEAKKQVRIRYLDLLKEAKKMEEILQVQDEINSIQEDIEAADGRINYLTHQAAFSTINVKYYQYLNGITAKDTEPDFFRKVSVSFKEGVSVIANILLFFIAIWPLILSGIIAWVWIKRMKLARMSAQK